MTLPRNRTLKCVRGFQAQADVPINSPSQTNNQNVNVIVADSALTKDRAFKILTNKNTEEKQVNVQKRNVELERQEQPLDDELEETFKERSIETAKESLEEFRAIIKEQNNLIEALSLILDMYEHNPVIVNKYIIAEEDELSKLLFLLTGADEIELIKTDPETGCSCKVDKFTHIQKIMVRKNGNTYNFKYSFPNVIQLLDNRRISWKIVC